MHTRRRTNSRSLLLAAVLVLAGRARAHAADTTEPFDVGATDVDLYLGLHGVGHGKANKITYGEIMLGYGLTDRLSAHVGVGVASNEFFSEGTASLSLGAYGTVIETRHLDLDLFLQLAAGGPGFGEVELSPAIELNVDSRPDMLGWGLYLRAGLPISGRQVAAGKPAPGADGEEVEHRLALATELTLGAYYTITEGHQLLLEHDLLKRFDPTDDERGFEIGGLALGYNVGLGRVIELINQVYVDLPQGDEKVAVGFMTGLIATLPSAHK